MVDGARPVRGGRLLGVAGANPRERFGEIATGSDAAIDLAEAALWIAAEEYADLDVARYLARLDSLADAAAPEIAQGGDAVERIATLVDFFRAQGFRGNTQDYYDPRNSFLNEVLERRLGIPITLALVMQAVGHRLGLGFEGVSFPGHFLLRCAVPDGLLVVDAFERAILDRDACQRRLDAALPMPALLEPAVHLRAAPPREILGRLLGNLKRIYADRGDLERTLGCCDRILMLLPDSPTELRDRALVYEGMSLHSAAAADLDRALELLPGHPDAAALRAKRDALRAKRGAVH
ncbi:MAG TPA: tetratricopeptide repeat protein [Myxococcota bacterium]|nr:tetratricopeptide repeat protein [Myxococcota bacterium]